MALPCPPRMNRHHGLNHLRSGQSNGNARPLVQQPSRDTTPPDHLDLPYGPTNNGASLLEQQEWHRAWQRSLGPGTPPPRQPWDPFPAAHQQPDQHVLSMRDQQPSHLRLRESNYTQAILCQRKGQMNGQAPRDENEDSRQGRSYRHFRDLELQRHQEAMEDLFLMYNNLTTSPNEEQAATQGRQVDHSPHIDELRYEERPISQQQHQQQNPHQLTTRSDQQSAPVVDPYSGAGIWTDTRAGPIDDPWRSAGYLRTRRGLGSTRRIVYRRYPGLRTRMIPHNPTSWVPVAIPYTLYPHPYAPVGNKPSRGHYLAPELNNPQPFDEPQGQRREQEVEIEEEGQTRALEDLARLNEFLGSWHARSADHWAQIDAMTERLDARRPERERERQDEDAQGQRRPRAERAHSRREVNMSWDLAARERRARVAARVGRQLAREVESERLREDIEREEEEEQEGHERSKRKRKKTQQKEDNQEAQGRR